MRKQENVDKEKYEKRMKIKKKEGKRKKEREKNNTQEKDREENMKTLKRGRAGQKNSLANLIQSPINLPRHF